MSRFDEFVKIVLEEEGPLSNDRFDPGGLTKFGLAQAKHPELDVASLTREEAIAVYKDSYWSAVQADSLPAPLDVAVGDCAVNQGVFTAIKALQQALMVPVDGVIGPATLAAATASTSPAIVLDYFARRSVLYAWDAGFGRYGHGWLARCFKLAHRLLA